MLNAIPKSRLYPAYIQAIKKAIQRCVWPWLFWSRNRATKSLKWFVNSVKLFADDVKLYSEMSTPSSASTFQEHLNHIHKWSIDWQLTISLSLSLSLSKCNLFELGPHCLSHPFFLSTTQLPYTDTVKDLGINIGPNLKFCQHISEITARANQRSHLIHRCFLSRNIKHLINAFIVYVWPLLEYVSPVWSPSQLYAINSIEWVQRSFTKRLPGFSKFTYEERLFKQHLPSLEHRRLVTDLVTCFNIIHGFTSLKFDNFLKFSPNRENSRGHQLRLVIPLSKTNTHKFFFSSRVVIPWNSLLVEVVTSVSAASFKKKITQNWP